MDDSSTGFDSNDEAFSSLLDDDDIQDSEPLGGMYYDSSGGGGGNYGHSKGRHLVDDSDGEGHTSQWMPRHSLDEENRLFSGESSSMRQAAGESQFLSGDDRQCMINLPHHQEPYIRNTAWDEEEDDCLVMRIRGGGTTDPPVTTSVDFVVVTLSLSATWRKRDRDGGRLYSRTSRRKTDTFKLGMNVNQFLMDSMKQKTQRVEVDDVSTDASQADNLVAFTMHISIVWAKGQVKFQKNPHLATSYDEAVKIGESLLKSFEDRTQEIDENHDLEQKENAPVADKDSEEQLLALQGLMDDLESHLTRTNAWSDDLEKRLNALKNDIQQQKVTGNDAKSAYGTIQTKVENLKSELSATNRLSADVEDRFHTLSETASDLGWADSTTSQQPYSRQEVPSVMAVDFVPGSSEMPLDIQLEMLKGKLDNLQQQLGIANEASATLERRCRELYTSIEENQPGHDDGNPQTSGPDKSRGFEAAFAGLSGAGNTQKQKEDSFSIDSSPSGNEQSSADSLNDSEPPSRSITSGADGQSSSESVPPADNIGASSPVGGHGPESQPAQRKAVSFVPDQMAKSHPPGDENDSVITPEDLPSLVSSASADSFDRLFDNDLSDHEFDVYTNNVGAEEIKEGQRDVKPGEADNKHEGRAGDFTNAFAALSSPKPQAAEIEESLDSSVVSIPSASYKSEISKPAEEPKRVPVALKDSTNEQTDKKMNASSPHGQQGNRAGDFTNAFSALSSPKPQAPSLEIEESLDSSVVSIPSASYKSETSKPPDEPNMETPKEKPITPVTNKDATNNNAEKKANQQNAATSGSQQAGRVGDFTNAFSALSAPKPKAPLAAADSGESVDSSVMSIPSASYKSESTKAEEVPDKLASKAHNSSKPSSIPEAPKVSTEDKTDKAIKPARQGDNEDRAEDFTSAFSALSAPKPKAPAVDSAESVDSSVLSIPSASYQSESTRDNKAPAKKAERSMQPDPSKASDTEGRAGDFTNAFSALSAPKPKAPVPEADDGVDSSMENSSVGKYGGTGGRVGDFTNAFSALSAPKKTPAPEVDESVDSSVLSIPSATYKSDSTKVEEAPATEADKSRQPESKSTTMVTTADKVKKPVGSEVIHEDRAGDFTNAFSALSAPKSKVPAPEVDESVDSSVENSREDVDTEGRVGDFTNAFSALSTPKPKAPAHGADESVDSSVLSIPSASYQSESTKAEAVPDKQVARSLHPSSSNPETPKVSMEEKRGKPSEGPSKPAVDSGDTAGRVGDFTNAFSALSAPTPKTPAPEVDESVDSSVLSIPSASYKSESTKAEDPQAKQTEKPLQSDSSRPSSMPEAPKASMEGTAHKSVEKLTKSDGENGDNGDKVGDFTNAFSALSAPKPKGPVADSAESVDSSVASIPSASYRSASTKAEEAPDKKATKGLQANSSKPSTIPETPQLSTEDKTNKSVKPARQEGDNEDRAGDFTSAFSALSAPKPKTAAPEVDESVDSSVLSIPSASYNSESTKAEEAPAKPLQSHSARPSSIPETTKASIEDKANKSFEKSSKPAGKDGNTAGRVGDFTNAFSALSSPKPKAPAPEVDESVDSSVLSIPSASYKSESTKAEEAPDKEVARSLHPTGSTPEAPKVSVEEKGGKPLGQPSKPAADSGETKGRAGDFTNAFSALSSPKPKAPAVDSAESVDSSVLSIPSASYKSDSTRAEEPPAKEAEKPRQPESKSTAMATTSGKGKKPVERPGEETVQANRAGDFTNAFSALSAPKPKAPVVDSAESVDSSVLSIPSASYKSDSTRAEEPPAKEAEKPRQPELKSTAMATTAQKGKKPAERAGEETIQEDRAGDFTNAFSALSTPKPKAPAVDSADSVDSSVLSIPSASYKSDSTRAEEPPAKEAEKARQPESKSTTMAKKPADRSGVETIHEDRAGDFTNAFSALSSPKPPVSSQDIDESLDSSIVSIPSASYKSEASNQEMQDKQPPTTSGAPEDLIDSKQSVKHSGPRAGEENDAEDRADAFVNAFSALSSPKHQAAVDDNDDGVDSSVVSIPSASYESEDKAGVLPAAEVSDGPMRADIQSNDNRKGIANKENKPVEHKGVRGTSEEQAHRVDDFTAAFSALAKPLEKAVSTDDLSSVDSSVPSLSTATYDPDVATEQRAQVLCTVKEDVSLLEMGGVEESIMKAREMQAKPEKGPKESEPGKKVDDFTKAFSSLNSPQQQMKKTEEESQDIDESICSIPSASYRSSDEGGEKPESNNMGSKPSAAPKESKELAATHTSRSSELAPKAGPPQKVDDFTKAFSALNSPPQQKDEADDGSPEIDSGSGSIPSESVKSKYDSDGLNSHSKAGEDANSSIGKDDGGLHSSMGSEKSASSESGPPKVADPLVPAQAVHVGEGTVPALNQDDDKVFHSQDVSLTDKMDALEKRLEKEKSFVEQAERLLDNLLDAEDSDDDDASRLIDEPNKWLQESDDDDGKDDRSVALSVEAISVASGSSSESSSDTHATEDDLLFNLEPPYQDEDPGQVVAAPQPPTDRNLRQPARQWPPVATSIPSTESAPVPEVSQEETPEAAQGDETEPPHQAQPPKRWPTVRTGRPITPPALMDANNVEQGETEPSAPTPAPAPVPNRKKWPAVPTGVPRTGQLPPQPPPPASMPESSAVPSMIPLAVPATASSKATPAPPVEPLVRKQDALPREEAKEPVTSPVEPLVREKDQGLPRQVIGPLEPIVDKDAAIDVTPLEVSSPAMNKPAKAAVPPENEMTRSFIKDLEALQRLQELGALTEDEFQQAKARIWQENPESGVTSDATNSLLSVEAPEDARGDLDGDSSSVELSLESLTDDSPEERYEENVQKASPSHDDDDDENGGGQKPGKNATGDANNVNSETDSEPSPPDEAPSADPPHANESGSEEETVDADIVSQKDDETDVPMAADDNGSPAASTQNGSVVDSDTNISDPEAVDEALDSARKSAVASAPSEKEDDSTGSVGQAEASRESDGTPDDDDDETSSAGKVSSVAASGDASSSASSAKAGPSDIEKNPLVAEDEAPSVASSPGESSVASSAKASTYGRSSSLELVPSDAEKNTPAGDDQSTNRIASMIAAFETSNPSDALSQDKGRDETKDDVSDKDEDNDDAGISAGGDGESNKIASMIAALEEATAESDTNVDESSLNAKEPTPEGDATLADPSVDTERDISEKNMKVEESSEDESDTADKKKSTGSLGSDDASESKQSSSLLESSSDSGKKVDVESAPEAEAAKGDDDATAVEEAKTSNAVQPATTAKDEKDANSESESSSPEDDTDTPESKESSSAVESSSESSKPVKPEKAEKESLTAGDADIPKKKSFMDDSDSDEDESSSRKVKAAPAPEPVLADESPKKSSTDDSDSDDDEESSSSKVKATLAPALATESPKKSFLDSDSEDDEDSSSKPTKTNRETTPSYNEDILGADVPDGVDDMFDSPTFATITAEGAANTLPDIATQSESEEKPSDESLTEKEVPRVESESLKSRDILISAPASTGGKEPPASTASLTVREKEYQAPRNFLDEFTKGAPLADPAGFTPDVEDYRDSISSTGSNVSIVSVNSDLTGSTGDFPLDTGDQERAEPEVPQPKMEVTKTSTVYDIDFVAEPRSNIIQPSSPEVDSSDSVMEAAAPVMKKAIQQRDDRGISTVFSGLSGEEKTDKAFETTVTDSKVPPDASAESHPFDESSHISPRDVAMGYGPGSSALLEPRLYKDKIRVHAPQANAVQRTPYMANPDGKLTNVNDAFERLNRIKDRLRSLRLLMNVNEQSHRQASGVHTTGEQVIGMGDGVSLTGGALADFSQDLRDARAAAGGKHDPATPSPIDEAYESLLRAQSKLRSLRALAKKRNSGAL